MQQKSKNINENNCKFKKNKRIIKIKKKKLKINAQTNKKMS